MTPRGRALLPELGRVMSTISDVTERPGSIVPERIRRTFVVRANEAVIASAGAELVTLARREAPHAEIRFELETADDIAALRSGDVDLAIGSYSDATSDIRSADLLDERLVAVVRRNHPHLSSGSRPSLKRFAALEHLDVSRKGRRKAAIDGPLAEASLRRNVLAVVPSFAVALAIVARSDATAIVPSRLASILLEGGSIVAYRPPITLPAVTISQLWHDSNTHDQPHQWLRSCVTRAATTVV
jgi:DNA-binding transcriptional LysR family regulator